jgi:uncharacterized membrane protein
MRKSEIIIVGIVLISFIIGIYFYAQMPSMMASHWNAQGEVDGYMSKFWGVFLFPIILIGLLILFNFIPKIDPLKENIKKFRKYFDTFIILMTIFLSYIYCLTLFWNLGKRFDMNTLIIPAIGIIFYYSGVLMENAKRNWFIGIRTPWTLSSENVWNKTHKVGAKLFKIAGVITFVGVLFGEYTIFLILGLAIFISVYTIIYSYLGYKKEKI